VESWCGVGTESVFFSCCCKGDEAKWGRLEVSVVGRGKEVGVTCHGCAGSERNLSLLNTSMYMCLNEEERRGEEREKLFVYVCMYGMIDCI